METTWYTAAALKLLVWGALAAANIDLPPAKYDHPYRGHVQFVYDFPIESDGDYYWGYTVPPRRPGGKCLIHLSPIGAVIENQVMTEEMLRVLIRHETAHCGGWRHREVTLIGRNDPFIVGPENPPPWLSPPSVPPAPTTDANADNIKFKYLLQCGNAKSVPPDSDPDPIVWTRIATIEGGEIYIRHFAASGENYTRNEQYRDLKFWSEGKTDNWSGTSIKHPDRTMVGRLQMDKTDRWVEYVEKLYRGGKLQSTTTSACRYISPVDVGGKSYSPDDVGGKSYQQQLERCIWEPEAPCPD